jgi:N6-L-threonylcarbamoyladenine synthase
MYRKGIPNEEIAAYVLKYVENTLLLMTENIFEKYGKMPVLFSGGVMSNSIIRKNITEKLGNAYFAKPEFSSDNAAGIAILTALKSGECI